MRFWAANIHSLTVKFYHMKKLLLFFLVVFSLGFLGCHDDEGMPVPKGAEGGGGSNIRTVAEAERIALDAADEFFSEGTSRGAGRSVGRVKVVRSKTASRSMGSDTLLYIVNYANEQGFAVIAANPDIEPVMAVTEQGSYDPAAGSDCPGVEIFMTLAQSYVDAASYGFAGPFPEWRDTVRDDSLAWGGSFINPPGKDTIGIDPNPQPYIPPGGGGGGGQTPMQTKETDEYIWFQKVEPRVAVRWGQSPPLGEFCRNYTVGCAPLAIAQVMSYFKHPTSFSGTYKEYSNADHSANEGYHSFTVSWDYVVKHVSNHKNNGDCSCENYPQYNIHGSLSRLGCHIGYFSGLKDKDYASDGTHSNLDKTHDALKKYGYSVSDVRDYKSGDSEKIGTGLIIMRGENVSSSNKGSGHQWVLDGVRRYNVKHTVYVRVKDSDPWKVYQQDTYRYHMNHFNWGWDGNYNGWFNDNVFYTLRYNSYDVELDPWVYMDKDYSKDVRYVKVEK